MQPPQPQISLLTAYLLAIMNTLLIGLSFSFVKIAVTQAWPVDTLAFRFVTAWAICALFARLKGIRFDWKNSLPLLPMALCYPLFFFLFQGFGLLFATSGEAGILAATGPIFTAIIAAVFIKERYNLIQSISILLSVTGVIYIAIQQGASLNNLAGIVLLLLSAIAGAGYAVCNRTLVRSFSTFEITYYLMTVGAVAFVLASFVQHAAYGTFSTMFTPFTDLSFTVAILYLSIFPSLLVTVFVSLALNRHTAAGLTIFLNLSTVVAILVGHLWLGETVHAFHLIGAAMILAGVIGTNGFATPEKPEQKRSSISLLGPKRQVRTHHS